jgi:hypothetical protein
MLLYQEPGARRECSTNNARRDRNSFTLLVSIIDDVLLLLESSDEFDEEGSRGECSV